MYIIDNSNYYLEEEIQNYISNTKALEVLQDIDGAFDDMMNSQKWTEGNWLINRLKFELFLFAFYGKKSILI